MRFIDKERPLMKRMIILVLTFVILFGNGFISHAEGKDEKASAITEKIMKAWDNYDEYISFAEDEVSYDNFIEIYHEALLLDPDYYYVSYSVDVVKYDNDYIKEAYIKYEFDSKDAYLQNKTTYENLLNGYVANIKSEWSDMEKVQYINHLLCQICDYDETKQAEHNKDSFGVLMKGKAVCEGYSMAFLALSRKAGIESYLVTSASMDHAWNLVKINDNYYMIDVTWDDQDNDKYKFFMKSISWFNSKTGMHEASDYIIHGTSIPDIYVEDTTYDDYIWRNIGEDEGEIALDYQNLTFYVGSIIRRSGTKTKLQLKNISGTNDEISWSSADENIATVDKNGYVSPVKNGKTIITATYYGKSYECVVDIKDVRFYYWREYPGDPQSNGWVWDQVDLLAVGQTVKYKYVEYTFDEKGEVESEKDVTDNIVLTTNSNEYLSFSNGTVTALKEGANQENEESKLFCYFKDTNVSFDQYIFMNIFTKSKTSQNDNVTIKNDTKNNKMIFKSRSASGYFTLDDQFIHDSDWIFCKCKNNDIIWKSSDESVLKFGDKTGCTPNHIYSQVEYKVLKSGKVTVSVYYGEDLICSDVFEFHKDGDSSEVDNPDKNDPNKMNDDGKDPSVEKKDNDSKDSFDDKKDVDREGSKSNDVIAKGKILTDDSSKDTYKITSVNAKAGVVCGGTVSYCGPVNKNVKSAVIKDTVVIQGNKFKVTSIESKAFYNCKKLKKVTIGKNVKKIGSKAFYGCSKLKTVVIKSSKLKKGGIGSKAFTKISNKPKFTCPKAKLKVYKKFLKKSGVTKNAKYKKGK